ncbi:MAG: hypothetical protein H7222_07715 [Methylotenera sp.]|nr:hypothetical protein [Oligoflexia bacterium]
MSVTAAKLGQSPLTFDWSNMLRPGRSPDAALHSKEGFTKAWDSLKRRFEAGEVGFYQAPIDNSLSQAQESMALAESLLSQGIFKDCLFLGIGGSALGPISLLSALKHKCTTGLNFHVMENVDPTDWKYTLSKLQPESTLVVAVTKSGTTFETMSQLLLSLEWLGRERWKSHVVAITDPLKGDMKAFAQQQGMKTLHIGPSMGGRFSIFTPVGLFPAALAGLNVKEFLLGASQVRDYIEKTPVEKNPLFIVSSDMIQNFPKRPIHVCMPYSTQLKQLGSWFVQLWAESLGKDGKGFTPLSAMGATDQHSILQLLRDGPDDKVTWFMTVDKVEDEVKIPRLSRIAGDWTVPTLPAFALLEGHSLGSLLRTEYRATSLVLTKNSRPHFTIQLDTLNERSLGAIYFAYSVMTAFTGALWNVNPFDQPGVEEAKIYIRESLNSERASNTDAAIYDENSPVARLRREPSSRPDSDGNYE